MAEQAGQEQPLCMAKRIEELETQVRVMAESLREATEWMDDHPAMPDSSSMHEALSVRMPSPSAPEGWQLVPVEPTKAMREAFHEAHEEWESGDDGRLDCPDHQWRAMLAAAPKPEAK